MHRRHRAKEMGMHGNAREQEVLIVQGGILEMYSSGITQTTRVIQPQSRASI